MTNGDMRYAYIYDIARLFRKQSYPVIIMVLSDGPLRYSDIPRAILANTGVSEDERIVRRCLREMVDRDLLTKTVKGARVTYGLTQRGSKMASRLADLGAAWSAKATPAHA